MRSLACQLLVPLLASMLMLTTPVGTGQGVHQQQLLHPLFGHAHVIDGRLVSDMQMAAVRAAATRAAANSEPTRGPALGAGDGADAGAAGLALGPTLPAGAVGLMPVAEGRLRVPDILAPVEFWQQPEDPPPDPFAFNQRRRGHSGPVAVHHTAVHQAKRVTYSHARDASPVDDLRQPDCAQARTDAASLMADPTSLPELFLR